MMKKNDIEIKSAIIQKFRLRRSDDVYGILPEIAFCLDRFGIAKRAQQFELFGEYVCNTSFLVDLLEMFGVHYPHELTGLSANIIFLNGKPVGISPTDAHQSSWILHTDYGYQKVDSTKLFNILLAA